MNERQAEVKAKDKEIAELKAKALKVEDDCITCQHKKTMLRQDDEIDRYRAVLEKITTSLPPIFGKGANSEINSTYQKIFELQDLAKQALEQTEECKECKGLKMLPKDKIEWKDKVREAIRELRYLIALNDLAPRTENKTLLNKNLDKRKIGLQTALDLAQKYLDGEIVEKG